MEMNELWFSSLLTWAQQGICFHLTQDTIIIKQISNPLPYVNVLHALHMNYT